MKVKEEEVNLVWERQRRKDKPQQQVVYHYEKKVGQMNMKLTHATTQTIKKQTSVEIFKNEIKDYEKKVFGSIGGICQTVAKEDVVIKAEAPDDSVYTLLSRTMCGSQAMVPYSKP